MAKKSSGATRPKTINKTVSQHILAKALVGLPAPVRWMIGSRIGARMVLILVGLMLGYVMLNIRSESSDLNAKQAQVVREEPRFGSP